jgi:hypothetical protein
MTKRGQSSFFAACKKVTVPFLLLAALAPAAAHPRITSTITWSREISRIVERRCVRCHRPGGEAPMSLLTWPDARPWAKAIKEETLARRMPPWAAVRGYGVFANDPSLSPFEIDLIAAWADGGAPRGDDRDLAPARADAASIVENGAGPSQTTLTAGCGFTRLKSGVRIVSLRPDADLPAASIGVSLHAPSQPPQILALVRNYDPKRRQTYELQDPPTVSRGARLQVVSASAPCRIVVAFERRRQDPSPPR